MGLQSRSLVPRAKLSPFDHATQALFRCCLSSSLRFGLGSRHRRQVEAEAQRGRRGRRCSLAEAESEARTMRPAACAPGLFGAARASVIPFAVSFRRHEHGQPLAEVE
jgi:hypothetical protein